MSRIRGLLLGLLRLLAEPIRRLYRMSIWHPLAIPLGEWKYRNLKRVWMPFYASVAVYCGWTAVTQGSPLLNKLIPPEVVDTSGIIFMIAACIAFACVAFPALWAGAIASLLVIVSMLGAYISTIYFFGPGEDPNQFVIGMLTFGIPMAFMYLNLLGEEWKERRHEGEFNGQEQSTEESAA